MKLRSRHWSLVLALAIPLTFGSAHPKQRSARTDETATRQKAVEEDFANALVIAKDNYAGEIDYDRVTRSSIVGILRTLDPHSMYFDPKQWDEFQNDQRSRYFGIGSTIGQRGDGTFILSPADGTASSKAGLRYGDQIIGVDGESTAGWTSLQIRSKLLGPPGTTVVVKMGRLGEPKPLEFKLTRGAVPLPSVSSHFMGDNGIGYINMDRGFNSTTYDETNEALTDLRKQGMKALILDLRGNPGGLVDQAFRVANIFLRRGQKVLSLRGRVFETRDLYAYNNTPDDYPIVVLINRGSASAAEIVAGALQDHDRARIVGENSFGKGLVQNPFTLSDGSALILTTGHYYTPSGRLIQRQYAGRSFYDYYLQAGDKEAIQRSEEKRTDAGRTVYGGGGIQPDVEVKVRIPLPELEIQQKWFDPTFYFARYLVAGMIEGFAQYKIGRPADHSHALGNNEFLIDDKVIAAFKTFIREHKELRADESRVDKDINTIKRQIRYEVVTAAYGIEKAYQVTLEVDNQYQRAIGETPKAREMADNVRRLHPSDD
jgi:carboxyl-terminal processing protease